MLEWRQRRKTTKGANDDLDRVLNPFDRPLLIERRELNGSCGSSNGISRSRPRRPTDGNDNVDLVADLSFEDDKYRRLETQKDSPVRRTLLKTFERARVRFKGRKRQLGRENRHVRGAHGDYLLDVNCDSVGGGSRNRAPRGTAMASSHQQPPYPGGHGPPVANGGHGGPPGAVPPGQPPGGGGAPVPDSYFTESRKGEVNELRQLLRNFNVERDQKRKREIIKKVIAYMTLGIDVSRLFTEMMLAIETRDLVIKKMVYLFLCNYATSHPELAQMCTNTLQKDCGNEDPMVRGLALRALCSLRLPQMVEYISEPLRKSLSDGHAYVRKTGVMGILKLYHLDREAFERCNFNDILYDMLRDPDAQVVSNCILVLNEIMADGPNGGMAINRAIMLHLLNRIHEFSEFGILAVLDLVPRYIPANDEEGFQIMNLLDPVLRTSNSAAVLATVRAFLSLADQIGDDKVEMKRQVIGRIKAPLVTLIASGSSELAYCLMQHADALIDLCPGIFDDEYRQFYVRYHEPTHIKYLKVSMLPKLANPENAPDIVAELGECVADANSQLGRLSVRAMGRIACRDTGGPGCAESIARRLVEMLDLNVAHVSSEAATALADVLRRHPELKAVMSPPLPRALRYITEPAGRASIIFLLGECGDVVREAPYSLERLIDAYDDIKDAGVKTALLSSTMKLFFKRPPEVQKMLGRLLSKATEDVSSQDLHDRALLYYRLLRTSVDPKVAEAVINASPAAASGQRHFAEEEDREVRDALLEEFNTLSILYGSTSDNFIADEYQVKFVRMPAEHPLEAGAAPVEDLGVNAVADQLGQASVGDAIAAAPVGAASSAPAPAPAAEVDLLGFGDEPSPAPVAPAAPIALKASMSLTGPEYEAKWGAVADSDAATELIPLRVQPPSTDAVEGALCRSNIMVMASGELPTELKFFLYAQEEEGNMIFLLQAVVTKAPAEVGLLLTLKTSGGDVASSKAKAGKLIELVKSALNEFV